MLVPRRCQGVSGHRPSYPCWVGPASMLVLASREHRSWLPAVISIRRVGDEGTSLFPCWLLLSKTLRRMHLIIKYAILAEHRRKIPAPPIITSVILSEKKNHKYVMVASLDYGIRRNYDQHCIVYTGNNKQTQNDNELWGIVYDIMTAMIANKLNISLL